MVSLTSLAVAIAALAPLVAAQINGVCHDPIASQSNPLTGRKKLITGTSNGTTIMLPIKRSDARAFIPKEYKILKKQIKAWLPDLASDEYPMILQMDLMHDIINKGKKAGASGDYLRAALTFPFVDRLGDGYSAFAYERDAIISTSNSAAQSAYAIPGIKVWPGFFSACNGYEYDNGTESLPPAQRRIDQAAWTNVNTDFSNPDLAYRMTPGSSPYSAEFFQNVTSQPLFSTNANCDKVTRRLDTRVSKGAYAPVALEGDVAAMQSMWPVSSKTMWSEVYGLKVDFAYNEVQKVACSSLKGFSVVNA